MANSQGTRAGLYEFSENFTGTEPKLLDSYDTDLQYYDTILGYDSSTAFETAIKNSYSIMITKVKEYGGFYVARYEMGKGDNYSKINVTPTSASVNDENTWYGLYIKAQSYTNLIVNNSIKSQMIWGSQYDAMLNYALSNGNNSSKVTTVGSGNHSGTKLKTGTYSEGVDSINNIIDLEGNMYEWTQEAFNHTDNKYRIYRGGAYDGTAGFFEHSPDYRVLASPNLTLDKVGTRLSLYIQ